jgi:hypothetical protein
MPRIKPGMITQEPGMFDVLYSGIYTCKGSAAAEVIPIRGVRATDAVVITPYSALNHALSTAACGKDKVTATFADVEGTHGDKVHVLVVRDRRMPQATQRKY